MAKTKLFIILAIVAFLQSCSKSEDVHVVNCSDQNYTVEIYNSHRNLTGWSAVRPGSVTTIERAVTGFQSSEYILKFKSGRKYVAERKANGAKLKSDKWILPFCDCKQDSAKTN